jgi:S1-C subfamily serine protease
MTRLALAFAMVATLFCAPARAADFGDSAVEVVLENGHGSEVYIGNGYILTAAHVAADAKEGVVTIKRPRNAGWTDEWSAKVLWIDAVHDFALLKLAAVPPADLVAAKVACDSLTMGENVTIIGWPVDLGRIQSRGYVAGDAGKRDRWEVSYVVVAPIFFGNSGGPVYDKDGHVAALAVGIVSGTSLSIVVPTAAICQQLPADAK